MNNYEKYSNEYYEHYKFLKKNDFLINKSKEKYIEFIKNSIYNNINFFKIIISLILNCLIYLPSYYYYYFLFI